jgi:hypothetical protein
MATYSGSDKRLKYLFQNCGGGGGSCKVISGYYHDGDFYEDQSYTQIITGDTECLYIDLDTTTLYLFDGTDYVEVQGGGGSGGGSFACDLLFENTNLTPASGSTSVTKDYTLTASIDSYDAVLVMGYVFVNNSGVGNIASLLIAKSDYYARCTNQTDTVAWAYILNGSIPTGDNTRRLCFGFSDSTHIRTLSTRVSSEEPMLYKVYGLNFGGTAHTYTTTGQIVGTWIDGKPIYEISFSEVLNNMASGTAVQILDLSAIGIENVIKVNGGYWYEDTTTASSKRYVAQGVYCSFEYADSNNILYGIQSFTSTTSNRKYTWIGTIQYTKSTT